MTTTVARTLEPADLSSLPGYQQATLVMRWSWLEFDRPVPLLQRREIEVGDVVQSSHGYELHVTEVRTTQHPVTGHINDSVWIKGRLHSADNPTTRTEQSPGAIPLLERNGVRFGNVVGAAGVQSATKEGDTQ
jgi:hypothetical protein